MKSLSIGFSPCPNDTFIFCGLVRGEIPLAGINLQKEVLEDVETLNEWAIEGKLDITKLSFHALGHVLDKYVLLNSGAALGRGCGPLLITRHRSVPDDFTKLTVAVPGRYTTAAMLLMLFSSGWKKIIMMPFDQIMPVIEAGKVDCGVIIHEGRFTYQSRGLNLIADLGEWWEEMSGYPIPLGGIVARRSLGIEIIKNIDRSIKSSISWARKNSQLCQPYIKKYAQELDELVIKEHIGLYVNSFSEDLGQEGLESIKFFLEKGRKANIFPAFTKQPLTLSY